MAERGAAGTSGVVVTGAAGWLGRALTARLVADPSRQRIRLLARDTAQGRELAALHGERPGVEVVVGDLANSTTSARLLHGCGSGTTVFHAAGVIHPRRLRDLHAINAVGTAHLLDAALDRGVGRFVHVSSSSAFGTNAHPGDTFRSREPFHPYLAYGRSKMLAELAVADAARRGLAAAIVRPPWFYGPYQPARQTTFFRLVRAGRFPVLGDGDQRRSMVYVENLVDGALLAARVNDPAGRGWWIADARAYTVAEIVDTVGRAMRDEGYDVAAPRRRFPAAVGRMAEAGDRLLQSIGLYQQQLHVLGELRHTIACDVAAGRAELGYEPRFALYEGMRASVRWCAANGVEL